MSSAGEHEAGVAARQDAVPGFSTERAQATSVLVLGAGGLGGQIVPGLAKKGYRLIRVADPDVVERSNLNRQLFGTADLYQPKALRLARNASRQAYLGSVCEGHFVGFFADTADALSEGIHIAVVGVDNNETRGLAARYFHAKGVPVVFLAVNDRADFGWVYVQQAGGPCLGCMFPDMVTTRSEREPCRATPAVLDILLTVCGPALYAVDSVVMERPRRWNFKTIGLVGGDPDAQGMVERRPSCSICSSTGRSEDQGPAGDHDDER